MWSRGVKRWSQRMSPTSTAREGVRTPSPTTGRGCHLLHVRDDCQSFLPGNRLVVGRRRYRRGDGAVQKTRAARFAKHEQASRLRRSSVVDRSMSRGDDAIEVAAVGAAERGFVEVNVRREHYSGHAGLAQRRCRLRAWSSCDPGSYPPRRAARCAFLSMLGAV
eukprot:2622169-Pleurochrysis_carterae.AAC.10